MPKLILMAEGAEPQHLELRTPETRIGRAPSNDIRLDHDRVSRTHALLTIEGPFVTINDLKSRNGTFVNGARIDSQMLVSGDEVRIGQTVLRFVDGDQDVQAVEARRLPTIAGLLVDLDEASRSEPERNAAPAGSGGAGGSSGSSAPSGGGRDGHGRR